MDRKETKNFKANVEPNMIVVNLLWDMSSFMENPNKIVSLLNRIKNNKADDYDVFIGKIMKSRLKNLPRSKTFERIEKILENI